MPINAVALGTKTPIYSIAPILQFGALEAENAAVGTKHMQPEPRRLAAQYAIRAQSQCISEEQAKAFSICYRTFISEF